MLNTRGRIFLEGKRGVGNWVSFLERLLQENLSRRLWECPTERMNFRDEGREGNIKGGKGKEYLDLFQKKGEHGMETPVKLGKKRKKTSRRLKVVAITMKGEPFARGGV